jgi:hypothetical protein
MLDRARGDGITLTSAGYLPPNVVSEAMDALGWRERWIGTCNREANTVPILELRTWMQSQKLLRKFRGKLLPTKVGAALADNPAKLRNDLIFSLLDEGIPAWALLK